MNSLTYEYNGTLVAPSKPVKQLRKVKKTINIDSRDRDITKYQYNGDFVVYLPRVYKNVTSIRLKSANFPKLVNNPDSELDTLHAVVKYFSLPAGYNDNDTKEFEITSGTRIVNEKINSEACPNYFLVDIEGLNKSDECAANGNRSGLVDGYIAKIPTIVSGCKTFDDSGNVISYNDSSAEENIGLYTPPIENLDRLHIRIRLHGKDPHFIFWKSYFVDNGTLEQSEGNMSPEFDLSIEVEYLENGFDDFSSFETRLSERV